MPAKSAKQEKFMQAVAHNPAFAKKVGVSQSVGREFTKGSEMKAKKRYDDGGVTTMGAGARPMPRASLPSQARIPTLPSQASDRAKAIMAARLAARGPAAPTAALATPPAPPARSTGMKKGGGVKKMASGGYTRAADGIAAKGKTKGKIVKMAEGGLPSQASASATSALKARPALPSQAQGVRPFKKGGRACK